MTETEWLECAEPEPMLEFLRGKVSDRKLRLLAVACCRRVWNLLTDERSRNAVEVGEKYADRDADDQERERAYRSAHEAFVSIAVAAGWYRPTHGSPADVRFVVDQHASYAVNPASVAVATVEADVGDIDPFWMNVDDPISEAVSDRLLLREIFGNPFRQTPFDATRLTPTVVQLAQAIYDNRAFDRLPTLADALEDAGCTDNDILSHCRSDGPHVRGCWVVDSILGKG